MSFDVEKTSKFQWWKWISRSADAGEIIGLLDTSDV